MKQIIAHTDVHPSARKVKEQITELKKSIEKKRSLLADVDFPCLPNVSFVSCESD